MIRALILLLALIASPATGAPVYGPPAPAKAFVYPDRFTVQPDETLEQAQAKVEGQRRCAKRWALIGAVGGGALDIITTQVNQADGYREMNPVYGKRASLGEMLLFRGASGAFNVWHLTRSAKRNPTLACRTAKIYAGASFLPGVANIAVRVRF